MEEAVVRQAAMMYALLADLESVKVTVEAMKVENIVREDEGKAMAYPPTDFFDAAELISDIAEKLRNDI